MKECTSYFAPESLTQSGNNPYAKEGNIMPEIRDNNINSQQEKMPEKQKVTPELSLREKWEKVLGKQIENIDTRRVMEDAVAHGYAPISGGSDSEASWDPIDELDSIPSKKPRYERSERSESQPGGKNSEEQRHVKRGREELVEELNNKKLLGEDDIPEQDRVQASYDADFDPEGLFRSRGRRGEETLSVVEAEKEEDFRLEEGVITKDAYGETKVNCVESLAFEIQRTEKLEEFQKGGQFELLKEIEVNGKTEYEFQPHNFVRWVRHWMMYYHNESPDTEWDFGREIGIKRDYSPIALIQILNNPGRFFRSWKRVPLKDNDGKVIKDENGSEKTGHPVYRDLAEQIKKEIWLFSSSRSADIKYKLVMGDEEKLNSVIREQFYGNTFTKSVWDKRSGFYHMLSMPETYIDKKAMIAEGKTEAKDLESDHKVGEALNLAYLTYYNISDRKKLENLLGENIALLNPDKIKQALWRQAQGEDIPEEQLSTYIEPKLVEQIDKNLMTFINVFNNAGKPDRIVNLVRSLIREAIADKFKLYVKNNDGSYQKELVDVFDPKTGKVAYETEDNGSIKRDENGKPITKKEEKLRIDHNSVDYAETFAFSMPRWTGAAARNDTTAQGYDAWTRLQVTDEYRKKQLERKRGGAFGNPYTIHVLKQLATDLMTGTYVEAMARDKYHDDTEGNLTHKMTLDVLEEMNKAAEKGEEEYYKAASQLVFPQSTMRTYANDHLARSFAIFGQIQGAEELNLDKFTHFDAIRGITFDRKGFDETLKEKFFKPMRYGYSTYAQVNFAKKVRTSIGKSGEYEEVHLAEAMFGREIIEGISAPDLIKKGKKGISINADNWSEKINWDFINSDDGKIALWRQVALTRLAAEMYAHRDHHSTDPHLGEMYYEGVIRALEEIPDSVLGDETDLQASQGHGSFFSKEDIKWLRKKSSTESWRLFKNATIKQGIFGIGIGFKEFFKEIIKSTTKS